MFERLTGALARASVDRWGKQPTVGASVTPTVSVDGRYVAFASSAPLAAAADAAPAGVLGRRIPHVYVRDRQLGITRQIDASGDRGADGASWGPAIAADGDDAVFTSDATTLAANDRNRSADIFVADIRTGRIEVISRSIRGGSGNGRSGTGSISADGRFVAFQSEASDLVCAGSCDSGTEDINLL